MKEGWIETHLGNIISLQYGKPLKTELREPSGKYAVYGANGIKDRSNEYYYDKKTIIVGRKGSAGEVNLSEDKFWPLDVTYFVEFDEKMHDLHFLYYLLLSLELTKLAKGVKPGINRNEVYNLQVDIPTLDEQQRIVQKIDAAFTAIDQAIANTVKNRENIMEFYQSKIDELFTCSNNWIKCELSKHVKFIDYRGRTPKKVQEGLRLITAKNVKNGYLQIEPQEFVEYDIYESWMTRGIPRRGDVLFTSEAPLANVAQLDTDEKVVFAQRVIILQPDTNLLLQSFLKYLLLSNPIRSEIFKNGTGATVKGIKAQLLKKIGIYFPEKIEDQSNLVEKMDNYSQIANEIERQLQNKITVLRELKQSILQKAFQGELT